MIGTRATGLLGLVFLLSWGGNPAFAKGFSDLDGIWKLPSEYPGRFMYYFEVKSGGTNLRYPPNQAFEGQVPHAQNNFTPAGPGLYRLSPNVKTAEGPKNLFAALAEQFRDDPKKSAAFKSLASTGLTYKVNAQGDLEPQVPDELKVWLPKMVKSSPAEVAAAERSGAAFEESILRTQQLSFPQSGAVAPCPEGLKPLLGFPKEAFEELKKIQRFKPQRDSDAQIVAGRTNYTLFVQQSPNERSIAFFFFQGDNAKWGPLKMYKVSDNQWVIPNGEVDSVTRAPLCQRVSMQPPIPGVTGGRSGGPGSNTGAGPPPK